MIWRNAALLRRAVFLSYYYTGFTKGHWTNFYRNDLPIKRSFSLSNMMYHKLGKMGRYRILVVFLKEAF